MSGDVRPATQWKAFLESTPANTSVKIPGLLVQHINQYNSKSLRIPNTRIQLHCSRDGGLRWFDCRSEDITVSNPWEWMFINYVCRDCGNTWKKFAVLVVRDTKDDVNVEVMKLGEYPPFSAPISKRVEKLLEAGDLEMYRRGTRSEAQGLGVGGDVFPAHR